METKTRLDLFNTNVDTLIWSMMEFEARKLPYDYFKWDEYEIKRLINNEDALFNFLCINNNLNLLNSFVFKDIHTHIMKKYYFERYLIEIYFSRDIYSSSVPRRFYGMFFI